mmetsp:Transcript_23407/g.31361  ORF Transcript_23407/g.31361 Transcript_23407/m.31361 type:complete len:141 (-) Transcript_23407:2628-3050(-)
MKKPAFNKGTFRLPNQANNLGFVSFNPGPGSYSTRINSLGSQYVDVKGKDKHFKGLLTSQGGHEKNVYFTRENGGLKQHNQPLSLKRTVREGVDVRKEMLENTGPGHYEPKHPADIQKKKNTRAVKSQATKRKDTGAEIY